jgi:hypothetical protein
VAEKYTFLNSLPIFAVNKIRLQKGPPFTHKYKGIHSMDFSRGIAEMASSIFENRPNRLSARFSLHVNEIVLSMQYPDEMGAYHILNSSFESPEPMPWAK